MHAWRLCLCSSVLLVIAAGCGGESSDMPEVGTVSGTVTLDGEPLADASVLFHPTSGGRPALGHTDDKGHYTLEYNPTTAGAAVGENEVSISTYQPERDNKAGELVAERPEAVPERYSTTDIIKVEVKPGDNEIDLTLTN